MTASIMALKSSLKELEKRHSVAHGVDAPCAVPCKRIRYITLSREYVRECVYNRVSPSQLPSLLRMTDPDRHTLCVSRPHCLATPTTAILPTSGDEQSRRNALLMIPRTVEQRYVIVRHHTARVLVIRQRIVRHRPAQADTSNSNRIWLIRCRGIEGIRRLLWRRIGCGSSGVTCRGPRQSGCSFWTGRRE